MNLAFYGTLRDPEVLARATGQDLSRCFHGVKFVRGWACYHIQGVPYPLLLAADDLSTPFSLYRNCPETAWESLLAYEGDEYGWTELSIAGDVYRVFMPIEGLKTDYDPWDLETFQAMHKADYMRTLDLCN